MDRFGKSGTNEQMKARIRPDAADIERQMLDSWSDHPAIDPNNGELTKEQDETRVDLIFADHHPPRRRKMPPSLSGCAIEPVKYIGREQPDKHFHHGGLGHAVGVHRYQAFRANRANPPEGGWIGYTYNHAPMLCFWNGTFYLQFLDNLKEEHNPPGRTLLATSRDGRLWSPAGDFPHLSFTRNPLPGL